MTTAAPNRPRVPETAPHEHFVHYRHLAGWVLAGSRVYLDMPMTPP